MASIHPIQSPAYPAQPELEQHDRQRHKRTYHHLRINRKAGICQGLGNVPDQARHLVGNGCHLKTFDGPLQPQPQLRSGVALHRRQQTWFCRSRAISTRVRINSLAWATHSDKSCRR